MTFPYSVKECLRGYTNDALAAMCERWNVSAGNKIGRIRAMEKILGDPLHIREAIAGLLPAELRILELVGRYEGALAHDLLGVPALTSKGSPADALVSLATLGLLLVPPRDRSGAFSLSHLTRHEHAGGASCPLILNAFVLRHLTTPSPVGYDLPPPAIEPEAATVVRKDAATAAFLETLRVVEVLGPRVTASGELHKTDGSRARELASEAGVSREALRLALTIARQLGCVEIKEGRLVTTARAEMWAQSGRAQRMRELYQAYLASDDLPDLQLFFPQVFSAMESRMPSGSLRRRYHKLLVGRMLAELPPDAWIPLDAFVDAIRRTDEDVLFLGQRWRAIAANARDVSAAWRERTWQNHERRLFQWMLQSLLANFGMVDLADDGRLFRVTDLGRFALGVGPAPEDGYDVSGDALVVQPDFEVIAYLDRCPADLRRKLDVFCERLRGGPVSTYRLTPESVYRGVRSGVSTEEFIRILESHSRRPMPDNVREQFGTWNRKVAAVTIRSNCRLLEYPDEADARRAVEKDSSLRIVGGRFVLAAESLPQASQRIDYKRPLAPCIVQSDGLTLHVPWDRANLFVRRRLEELGEVSQNGTGDIEFCLSKAKTRRDVDWGLQAAQLETLVEGPLAARYRAALRAWSGDVGPPSAQTVTLVRFEDAEACEAVLELPDVAEHVEGRLGLYTLVVRKGGLTSVKRALKTFGMPVGRNGLVLDDGPPENWVGQWIENRQTHEDHEESAVLEKDGEEVVEEEAIELPSYSPRIVGEIIDDAIRRRRPILIQYQSTWSPKPTVRRVNPVSLDTVGATPSVSGYCHRLGGARVFKLARISGIRVLEDESF